MADPGVLTCLSIHGACSARLTLARLPSFRKPTGGRSIRAAFRFLEKVMTSLAVLTQANAKRWSQAQRIRDFTVVARRLAAAKARYQAVSSRTGVPWFVIAVIHERECSQNWIGSLAQGDPWNEISAHVPAGRGPFRSWEEAAVDALANCAPYAARWTDWSAGGALTLLERYNGLGYANRGVPSPYVWAGTDQYRSGKYVRDGVYDPTAVDRQPGCAGLLMAMMQLDPTVGFTQPIAMPRQGSPPDATSGASSKPSITSPAQGSLGAFFVALFKTLLGRK
jgi:lysozyme family protein